MLKQYKCPKCDKVFKRKYNYENHLFSTGIPCNYTIANTTKGKELLMVTKKNETMVSEKTNMTEKMKKKKKDDEPFLKQSFENPNNGNGITTCKFCGIPLVTPFEVKQHFLNSSCMYGNSTTITFKNNDDSFENHDKKQKEYKPLNIYNTEIHNHINAQIINHNETKNINIVNNNLNVYHSEKINAFGKENLDMITPDMLDGIIENPNGGIVKLIKIIHFNPDVPENRNVVIRNKKDPYFDVFNGDYWEKQEKDTTIHNLISTKKDIMDDHFETMVEKNMVTNLMSTNYNDFSDKLDPYLKDNLDSLLDEKLNKKNISRKCETIYKKLYGKIMLLMMNDKEINKVLQRKLNKLSDGPA